MHHIIIPDPDSVRRSVDFIFELLFQTRRSLSETEVKEGYISLEEQMRSLLKGLTGDEEMAIRGFIKSLDRIKEVLLKDAAFILESDPAAKELIEVIAIYPGFNAIFCYRIANLLAHLPVRLLPRMITEYAHRITGIDIHPLATIGSPFSIDHGTGIVIGETTNIGNFVKIYQGVTLGALSVVKAKASKKRHPTIEDHVILYAGSTILGGETVVGRNSIIGGNVWLTESIQPDSVVYHKSEIIVKNQENQQK